MERRRNRTTVGNGVSGKALPDRGESMAIDLTTSVGLNDLPALLARLRQPVPPEEIRRRKQLGKKTRRLREAMEPLDVPVEVLIRESREENGMPDA